MNKFSKYIISIIVFIIITFIAIEFPNVYFKHIDNMLVENVSFDSINLHNLYDNYNLTTLEKIEILQQDPITLLGSEAPSEENYLNFLSILKKELEHIDSTLYKNLFDILNTPYKEIKELIIEKNFISLKDMNKSIVLRTVSYSTDNYYINYVMDVCDESILYFYIGYLKDTHYSIFQSLDFKEIYKNYANYLDVQGNYLNVNITDVEIYLGINRDNAQYIEADN